MNIFKAMRISATGLSAERLRMDVISANIANANSTRSPGGGPYKRQVALLAAVKSGANSFKNLLKNSEKKVEDLQGVRVVGIVEDGSPPKRVYDPKHPDALPDGYVEYPNVDVMKEMVELITASRAYEANITVLNSTKSMALKTLEIGQG
ncbi:MAG: flagellar basal body rod protein FlgC [Peptococcaceae bacterium]|jgi:flagellar basal-body rod protein FlgC|nr:flagellar basal body rod protein FlgC [Peptococcaceae bacterium]MDH7524030.1 flagellar basal body rod protein FlgC [Peptococcaceae bacterium]